MLPHLQMAVTDKIKPRRQRTVPCLLNAYSRPLMFVEIYTLLDFYHGAELPLVEACGKGNYEVVAALLKKGADPNKHREGYWSPIENTFAQGSTECIEIAELLIQYGACVDLNGSSETALFHVIFVYKFRQISEKDADFLNNAITLLLDNGASAYHNGEYCVTHFLATMGNVELLDCIATKYSLPVDCKTLDGETPLMFALRSEKSQSIDMVAYLLEGGADVCATNSNGKSVLEYAKETGNMDIISVVEKEMGRRGDGTE